MSDCANNFNSIKVQLKLLSVRSGSFCMVFQFHKGTIKTVPDTWKALLNLISIP